MDKEYIEREALLKTFDDVLKYQEEQDYWAQATTTRLAINKICNAPTADVAPVRHGEWIDKCARDWHCSLCDCEIQKVRKVDGYCYDDLPNYCPDCGAKMSGGKE